jgi:hypothetical protein
MLQKRVVMLWRATSVVAPNYDAGETSGWPTYVRKIAVTYRSLPVTQRSTAIALGSNYGEADAVDHFGHAYRSLTAHGVRNTN